MIIFINAEKDAIKPEYTVKMTASRTNYYSGTRLSRDRRDRAKVLVIAEVLL